MTWASHQDEDNIDQDQERNQTVLYKKRKHVFNAHSHLI